MHARNRQPTVGSIAIQCSVNQLLVLQYGIDIGVETGYKKMCRRETGTFAATPQETGTFKLALEKPGTSHVTDLDPDSHRAEVPGFLSAFLYPVSCRRR